MGILACVQTANGFVLESCGIDLIRPGLFEGVLTMGGRKVLPSKTINYETLLVGSCKAILLINSRKV